MIRLEMRKIMIMIFICLCGAMLNIGFNKLSLLAGLPLYLDTVLTVSVTLACGFIYGAICGLLTNVIGHTISGGGWEGYLFVICNVATAFITWFFMRLFPRELNLTRRVTPKPSVYKSSLFTMVMDRVVVLLILSFTLCLAMSFLGGLIAAFILTITSQTGGESRFVAYLSQTMFKGSTPLIISEIVSRIPVNIIDRLISAFGGFLIALGFRRII